MTSGSQLRLQSWIESQSSPDHRPPRTIAGRCSLALHGPCRSGEGFTLDPAFLGTFRRSFWLGRSSPGHHLRKARYEHIQKNHGWACNGRLCLAALLRIVSSHHLVDTMTREQAARLAAESAMHLYAVDIAELVRVGKSPSVELVELYAKARAEIAGKL